MKSSKLHETAQDAELESCNQEQERIHSISQNGIILNSYVSGAYQIRYLFSGLKFPFWCSIVKQQS